MDAPVTLVVLDGAGGAGAPLDMPPPVEQQVSGHGCSEAVRRARVCCDSRRGNVSCVPAFRPNRGFRWLRFVAGGCPASARLGESGQLGSTNDEWIAVSNVASWFGTRPV